MDLLIGFTGPPGCGKDAAADHLVTHHDFRQVAFADPIRQAALALNPMVDSFYKLDEVVRAWGWTDAKHRWPEVRRCLQVLGTEVGRDMFGPDIWINRTFQKIETFQPGQRVVITDVRFRNEADALWARGGYLIRLRREAHHHFAFEGWPAFGSLYGLISCVLIIVVSKFIGKRLLMRKEDYYDS